MFKVLTPGSMKV